MEPIRRRTSRRRAIAEPVVGILAILTVIALGSVFARGLEAMGVGLDLALLGGMAFVFVVLGYGFYREWRGS